MNWTLLERNAARVHATIVEKGDALVTTTGCKIYMPARFADRHLAFIGSVIRIVGIYAIVVDDKFFGVSSALAMINISPDSTTMLDIDGDSYYEFTFEAGSQITDNVNLIMDDQICYKVFDEIIAKGNHPWFFDYSDLGKLWVSGEKHAGVTFYANNAPWELLIATIARQQADRTKYYRHQIQTLDDEKTMPAAYVPFRSVIYNAAGTVAKVSGSYPYDGLLSALVTQSTKVEGIEGLLRS